MCRQTDMYYESGLQQDIINVGSFKISVTVPLGMGTCGTNLLPLCHLDV